MTVGSPERASSMPSGVIGGASMAAPAAPAPVVKCTPADFDRENAAFRPIYEGRELTYPIFDRYFSWGMYDASDRTVVQCWANRYHKLDAVRAGSIRDTHLAVMILNRFLCDPKTPLELNVSQIYQRILSLVSPPPEVPEGYRTEMRKRAINVSLNFYKKPIMLFAKYLMATGRAVDAKEAVRKMTHNEACGNFVDAIACEMARLANARADR